MRTAHSTSAPYAPPKIDSGRRAQIFGRERPSLTTWPTELDLETEVLRILDPPLNLAKVPVTALRRRLTELRRQH